MDILGMVVLFMIVITIITFFLMKKGQQELNHYIIDNDDDFDEGYINFRREEYIKDLEKTERIFQSLRNSTLLAIILYIFDIV